VIPPVHTPTPPAPARPAARIALALAAAIALGPAAVRAVEPAVHAEASIGIDTNPLREAGGEQGAYPFVGGIADVGLAYGGERTALNVSLSEGFRLFLAPWEPTVSDADVLASQLAVAGTWSPSDPLELGAGLFLRDLSERGGIRSETGGRARLDAKLRLARFDLVAGGGASALYPRTQRLEHFASVGPDAGVEVGFSPVAGQRVRLGWELHQRHYPRWTPGSRDDVANGLVLEWSRRGPVILGAGYAFTRNRSTVPGGFYLRHRVWLQAATALPWDSTLALLGSLQRSTYPDGILSDALRLVGENDERENAIEARIARPLGKDLEIVIKAGAYLGEFATGDKGKLIPYRREVVQLSIGWRPE
jgi:hypothetical protein